MTQSLLEIKGDELQYIGIRLSKCAETIYIPYGVTAVVGPNGSGKSIFGRIIERGRNLGVNRISSAAGGVFKAKMIEFNDIHSLAGCKTEYYQQRFEATMNDEVPTVAEVFAAKRIGDMWHEACGKLHLHDCDDKRLNYLSSGELRKLLLVNAICDQPGLLILDNPYIGLDAPSRGYLDSAIASLAQSGTPVMLLLANADEIPDVTGCVIAMEWMRIVSASYPADKEELSEMRRQLNERMAFKIDWPMVPTCHKERKPYDIAVGMSSCNVRYGDRAIIRDESWTVRAGERWGLAGRNGSGKSVLLSLIYADNPQVYSNDITLFDHKRGTGESIWDIKDRIGYVSPEMHLYFKAGGTALDVVARGSYSATGNYGKVTDEATDEARRWLTALGMGHLAERRYSTLSGGEQRTLLIARALMKHPDLLILDEPLHGLDAGRRTAMVELIDRVVRHSDMTLIYVTHYSDEVPPCVNNIKTLRQHCDLSNQEKI